MGRSVVIVFCFREFGNNEEVVFEGNFWGLFGL